MILGNKIEKKAIELIYCGANKEALELIIQDALNSNTNRCRYGYVLKLLMVGGSARKKRTWEEAAVCITDEAVEEFSKILLERYVKC